MDYRQLGVDLPHMLVGETLLIVSAGTAGLYPDVRPGDELLKGGAAALGAGVERHGEGVAVVGGIAVVAAGLAGHLGSLDLDDLGAHLGHHAGCVGACDIRAGHEHLHAAQYAELGILVKLHVVAIVIGVVVGH